MTLGFRVYIVTQNSSAEVPILYTVKFLSKEFPLPPLSLSLNKVYWNELQNELLAFGASWRKPKIILQQSWICCISKRGYTDGRKAQILYQADMGCKSWSHHRPVCDKGTTWPLVPCAAETGKSTPLSLEFNFVFLQFPYLCSSCPLCLECSSTPFYPWKPFICLCVHLSVSL